MNTHSRHQCFIYDGPPSRQLPSLAAMIERKLVEGYRCLYLNRRPMVASIYSCLAAIGVDVEHEIAKGRLVLSAEPVTSTEGVFDVDIMLHNLEDTLDQALRDGYKGLWATGDMTWEFGPEKNFGKLLEYERRLEELFQKRPELSGVCQYHQDTLPLKVARQGLMTHQTIFIDETLSRQNPHYQSCEQLDDNLASHLELNEAVIALCLRQNQKLD